jgi:hypothetical protein
MQQDTKRRFESVHRPGKVFPTLIQALLGFAIFSTPLFAQTLVVEPKQVLKSSLTTRLVSQPEVAGEDSGLLQAFVGLKVENILANRVGRLVN